ncbi:MAG: hypothetical protein IJR85_04590 [Synergistaceae bacterium]|nr:hypothetical protein [Synergistaceae bacterium]
MYQASETRNVTQRHLDMACNELARAIQALRYGDAYTQQVEAERAEGVLDAVLGRVW